MRAIAGNIHAEFGPILSRAASRRAISAHAENCKAWPARDGSDILLDRWEDSVSEGDTRAIVRELYDAYGRRDFERVAALIHDDIDWVIYAPMSVFPFAGPRRGRAAVLAAMAEIAAGLRAREANVTGRAVRSQLRRPAASVPLCARR